MLKKRPYLNLLEESFPGIKANVARCETLGFPWPSKPFLKEVNGEIVSHVGFIEYPMVIEGQPFKACAIHAICTKTAYRNQGFASALIQEALEWAKDRYESTVLFTEIPHFYEKLSFKCIQEYRFHLTCEHPKGSQPLRPIIFPEDNPLFLHSVKNRAPVSNRLWVKDNGIITAFNTLFATFPIYWSLHYSPSISGIISFLIKDKTLHLFDVIADKIPALDLILDHLPSAIDDIYFYFSPDRLTHDAVAEPHFYDHGHLMVHGDWPKVKPFMIPPLSRC